MCPQKTLHRYSTSDEVRKFYRTILHIDNPFYAMRLHIKEYFPKVNVAEIRDHLLEREFHENVTKAMERL